MKSKDYNPKEFIENVLIADIDKLIENGFEFFAFILICQGVEYLGNFFDDEKFEEYGKSEERFRNALKNLFNNSFYKNKQEWLFKNLRGNLIHQIRPSDEILLTSLRNGCPGEMHLKKEDTYNRTIFIIELFFEDFKKAIKKLFFEIEQNPGNFQGYKKFSSSQMQIFDLTILNKTFAVSGITMETRFQ